MLNWDPFRSTCDGYYRYVFAFVLELRRKSVEYSILEYSMGLT